MLRRAERKIDNLNYLNIGFVQCQAEHLLFANYSLAVLMGWFGSLFGATPMKAAAASYSSTEIFISFHTYSPGFFQKYSERLLRKAHLKMIIDLIQGGNGMIVKYKLGNMQAIGPVQAINSVA